MSKKTDRSPHAALNGPLRAGGKQKGAKSKQKFSRSAGSAKNPIEGLDMNAWLGLWAMRQEQAI